MTDRPSDRARWAARYAAEPADERAPSAWVMAACARLPVETTIVDVAAGSGRHAAALARAGRHVIAVDFVEGAIRQAAGCDALVHGLVADVWWMPLRPGSVESLLCTNFLERSLFGDFKALIRPGGFLIYETYTVQHLALVEAGRARAPRSAAYLLELGELARLVAPFVLVDAREGYVRDDAGERYCASALAQKGWARSRVSSMPPLSLALTSDPGP